MGSSRPDDGRLVDQGAGDGHALPLAARELRRPVRRPRHQVHDLQRGDGAPAGLLGRHAGDQQRQLDVLDGGEDGQQVVELEDEAHAARAVLRLGVV